MKQPDIVNSKKGAIFYILWILTENPTNLKYFRQKDISLLLEEYFFIKLDRKTIQDYISILIDLKLPLEILHDNNKGYYIAKKLLSNTERMILANSIFEKKYLDLATKNRLMDYITFDLSKDDKETIINQDKNYYSSNNLDVNITKNLIILQKAINERRKISFEYLNYKYPDNLMKSSSIYYTIPLDIKCINGIYYLYNAQKVWANAYCGIKIQYMTNIKILELAGAYEVDKELEYHFTLDIIYEWTIELIKDFFTDFRLERTSNGFKAYITAPYDYAVEWCKTHGNFFIINDDKIKNKIKYDVKKLLDSFNDSNEKIRKIKASIVDYHYKNSSIEMSYSKYMNMLKQEISKNIKFLGYEMNTQNDISIFRNEKEEFSIDYVEYCLSKDIKKKYDEIQFDYESEFKKLKDIYEKNQSLSINQKYLIILFERVAQEQIDRVSTLFNKDITEEYDDRFSIQTNSYFHNFSIIKI